MEASFKRSHSNTGFISQDLGDGRENGALLSGIEESLKKVEPDFDDLSVPKRLIRSFSQKLKNTMRRRNDGDEGGKEARISSTCIGLYVKGGGCRVGAYSSDELHGRIDGLACFADGNYSRKSSAGEECMGGSSMAGFGRWRSRVAGFVSGIEEARVDCFSYGVADKLWKRNHRKVVENAKILDPRIEITSPTGISQAQFSLPDDILEMCLARLPLPTLAKVRLVCKKWRSLTTTSRFMQMRYECSYQSPWLFVFGIVKDGYCAGQIQALDVSLDKWHRIDAGILRGKFSFSVAGLGSFVYIVGGCSSLTNFGKVESSSFKTHRGVVVFDPLIGSWSKAAPMKSARSSPVLGVFKIDTGSVKLCRHVLRLGVDSGEEVSEEKQIRGVNRFSSTNGVPTRNSLSRSKYRAGGVSEIYTDPHSFSLRCHESDECGTSKFDTQGNNQLKVKRLRRFVLIAVGGQGAWNEPLDSGEIYDPVTNRWIEIARLPGDFGVASTGAVCNGMFYVYSESDKLAAYDLERGIWIRIQTARSPPRLHEYFPKLVSCSDRLFMLCVSWCERDGQINRRDEAIRKLWELDFAYHAWTEISKHPDAPMDWNAAFVADRDRIFGLEMFKIFGQVLDFLTVCSVSDSMVKWKRMSRKLTTQNLDAASCMTKSMVILNL